MVRSEHTKPIDSENPSVWAQTDGFSESIGFVCSLRTTGHILIYELNSFSVLTISSGVIVSFVRGHKDHDFKINQANEDELRRLILRMLKPVDGLLCWCSPGPLALDTHLSLPLEHLFLDTIRKADEMSQHHKIALDQFPNTARLVPNLDASLNQRLLMELRAVLGIPPYLISDLQNLALSEPAIKSLSNAIESKLLIVERQHEVTAPPHVSASFDASKLALTCGGAVTSC